MGTDLMGAPVNKPKNFWEKPEGTTATVVNAVALGGGAIALVTFAPVLLTLMTTLFGAVLLAGLSAGAIFLAMQKNFRNLMWYGYQSAMRGVTSLFVTIDPIGILKNYVKYLKENLEKMDSQVSGLGGQMEEMKRTMDSNQSSMTMSLKLASKAKEKGDQINTTLNARKAGRLESSNITLRTLYTKMEVMYRVLSKMRDNASILIEDTESEIETREAEYNAMKAAHGAMKSAMSIINGDPDQRAMFEMSMEQTADSISQKLGDMQHFMEISQKVMDSVDLTNGVMTDDGLKMLEEWENKSTSTLLGDDKKSALDAAYDDKQVLDVKKGKKAKGSDLEKLM